MGCENHLKSLHRYFGKDEGTPVIRQEHARLLLSHTPSAIVGTLFAVLVLAVILSAEVDYRLILAWSVLMCAVLAGQYRFYLLFKRRHNGEPDIERWINGAVRGAFLTGCCWGIGGVVFASSASPYYQGAILLLIVGVTTSAIPFLGAIPKAYFAYSSAATLPLVVWCSTQGTPVYIGTAFMISVFIWAAWVTSSKYSESLHNLVRTRHKLTELSDDNKQLQLSFAQLSEDEREVRASEERFRGIFEGGLVGMVIVAADGVVQRVNDAYCDFVGYSRQELVGAHFGIPMRAEHLHLAEQQIRAVVRDEAHGFSEFEYRHRNGGAVYGLVSFSAITTENGGVNSIVIQIQDVTHEQHMKKQLTFQARHDELTGLVNRREFQVRLENAIGGARRENLHHALCYIDLDQFKLVNDTLGHIAGDKLLQQVASVMRQCVRGRDTLARLGGDEFGLILDNCPIEKAAEIAAGAITRLSKTNFMWLERTFQIRASIGVVPITPDSPAAADVLKQADLACYTAKDLGRGRIYVYPLDLDQSSRYPDILKVKEWLDAFREEHFRLFAQPIVSLPGQTTPHTWYEILLRIATHGNEVVSPRILIPAAERYGQMDAIDRWVIESSLRWHGNLFNRSDSTRFSINLSGASLSSEGLYDFIERGLEKYDVDPTVICFEITETAAARHLRNAGEVLTRLKMLGCLIALDNFGSGISSFKYLKQLPIDIVKIDGSLVHDMSENSPEEVMVDAIGRLARVMNIRTVAAQVQNDRSALQLKKIGIDYAQSFVYGKPHPIQNVRANPAAATTYIA